MAEAMNMNQKMALVWSGEHPATNVVSEESGDGKAENVPPAESLIEYSAENGSTKR